MTHLDLFSGIGGFAYAADQVWDDVKHIFCDNDKFCQQVLKKHWPESEIYDDIRDITDTTIKGLERSAGSKSKTKISTGDSDGQGVFILTGGFPCQPFSAAGLRRGTADERHLWPEMLRVIRLTQPTWVIAENVRGLLTWNNGVVFEQVCTDLEANGYEVQAFVIPAVAVNAPHRRDRIWFIANNRHWVKEQRKHTDKKHTGQDSQRRPANEVSRPDSYGFNRQASWGRHWLEVATELCSVDDGLPAELDGFKLSKSQHRKEQLKAYGNAIVPQIAIEIMKGMAL